MGRSLHWERGLKREMGDVPTSAKSRSLHWERGLKQDISCGSASCHRVVPFIGNVD